MALILNSIIPRALIIVSSTKLNTSIIPYTKPPLELCVIEPLTENTQTIIENKKLEYTNNNINKILEKMEKEYKIECCNECGNCK